MNFQDMMADIAKYGEQQERLAELEKDPVKNAAQIKFLRLSLGNEKQALADVKGQAK